MKILNFIKFKKISTKMLTVLLSVSMLSMILLSYVSYSSSKKIIESQIQQNMRAELDAQVNNILIKTGKIATITAQIARHVETTYRTTSLEQYEELLGKVIYESDLALGSGIWFEPYIYDAEEKYVGPYIYKDGETPVTTYDYSNEEYNYFNYDWYKGAMSGSKEPVFSALYYDATLNTTMASCTAPMYDSNDKFIGVITVDIEITAIQDLIHNLTIGKAGSAILLTDQGNYITNDDATKVMKEDIIITLEDNKSLAALGEEILKKDSGIREYTADKVVYEVLYSTIKELGWKMMIQIPEDEINAPLKLLMGKLVTISFIALLLTILAIISQVQYLTRNIKKVNKFALRLADGDFTTAEIEIKSIDELGQMGKALNKMLSENKAVIATIAGDSEEIRKVSTELEHSTLQLTTNFEKIKDAIKDINEDMMSSSAITEEVNASVEEVNASINFLAQETSNSFDMAIAIKDRALEVEKRSVSSYELATNLALVKEKNLNQSMEEAKIVESIGIMASTISEIAEKVNLLSLNAAIEAARAGEQGRGFAVVAKEIGSLAAQTTTTVNEISQTTAKVKVAFDNLMEQSSQLLSFIQETVTPDYKTFVSVGNQYRLDANDIQTTVTKIANMTNNIEKVINEVGEAIQGITVASENTANNSTSIIENMEKVAELVDDVSQAVAEEKVMSNNLDEMVKKFNL